MPVDVFWEAMRQNLGAFAPLMFPRRSKVQFEYTAVFDNDECRYELNENAVACLVTNDCPLGLWCSFNEAVERIKLRAEKGLVWCGDSYKILKREKPKPREPLTHKIACYEVGTRFDFNAGYARRWVERRYVSQGGVDCFTETEARRLLKGLRSGRTPEQLREARYALVRLKTPR